jgi:hypothetical protein
MAPMRFATVSRRASGSGRNGARAAEVRVGAALIGAELGHRAMPRGLPPPLWGPCGGGLGWWGASRGAPRCHTSRPHPRPLPTRGRGEKRIAVPARNGRNRRGRLIFFRVLRGISRQPEDHAVFTSVDYLPLKREVATLTHPKWLALPQPLCATARRSSRDPLGRCRRPLPRPRS